MSRHYQENINDKSVKRSKLKVIAYDIALYFNNLNITKYKNAMCDTEKKCTI